MPLHRHVYPVPQNQDARDGSCHHGDSPLHVAHGSFEEDYGHALPQAAASPLRVRYESFDVKLKVVHCPPAVRSLFFFLHSPSPPTHDWHR